MAKWNQISTSIILMVIVCVPSFLFFAEICTCQAHNDSRCRDENCCGETTPDPEQSHETCGCIVCNMDSTPVLPPSHPNLIRAGDIKPDFSTCELSAFVPEIGQRTPHQVMALFEFPHTDSGYAVLRI